MAFGGEGTVGDKTGELGWFGRGIVGRGGFAGGGRSQSDVTCDWGHGVSWKAVLVGESLG